VSGYNRPEVESAVSKLKVAVQLASLRQPVRRALQSAAQMRAEAIELDARGIDPAEMSQTGIRQIRKWISDFNLRVCAVSFRTRRGYDVAEDLDRRLKATKDAMRFAFALGANVVVNQVGGVPEDSQTDLPAVLKDALLDLGKFGHHVGAWMAAETGSESGPALARLVAALPTGYLPVALNPGNLIIHGYSVAQALEALGPHVIYVRARDAVPDLARGRGIEVPLGRGTADFPNIVGTLDQYGYRGYFTVGRDEADNPVREIGAAIEYLHNL
jgi:sugar phosphate isomerase/epimerase